MPCQSVTPEYKREPLQMTPLPLGPWKKVSVDFAGPFGKRWALVLWDQYSRTPVVEFVSSTSAECVMPKMGKIFNTFGVPEEIKSDNGAPFNSKKFEAYAEEQGFKHRKVTPVWPEANGDAERFMRTVKKSAKIAKMEGTNLEEAIQKTVRSYKAAPHPATGYSPNMSMFGRELRGKLPSILESGNSGSENMGDDVRERDLSKKRQWKAYADDRRKVSSSQIKMGDKVLIRKKRENMFTPYYDPFLFTVIGIKGSMITAAREGEIKCRNSSHFKRLRAEVAEIEEDEVICPSAEDSSHQGENLYNDLVPTNWTDKSLSLPADPNRETTNDELENEETSIEHSQNTIPLRKSSRVRVSTKNTRYKDYICD